MIDFYGPNWLGLFWALVSLGLLCSRGRVSVGGNVLDGQTCRAVYVVAANVVLSYICLYLVVSLHSVLVSSVGCQIFSIVARLWWKRDSRMVVATCVMLLCELAGADHSTDILPSHVYLSPE